MFWTLITIKVLENKNLKVYEGSFNEQSKNLSILKWEVDFINESYDLIFFIGVLKFSFKLHQRK